VRLRENRVLRKLCGRKSEEGGGGSRKLRDLYTSLCYWGDGIKEIETGGVFFGKPEGKGSLRRLRTEWEGRNEIDKLIECEAMDLFCLTSMELVFYLLLCSLVSFLLACWLVS